METTEELRPRTHRHTATFRQGLTAGAGANERMFNRLKDFRRIATRYDRLAAHVLATLQIVAVVALWL